MNLPTPVAGDWPHDSVELVWRYHRPDGGLDVTMTFPPVKEVIRLVERPTMRRVPQQNGHELIQVMIDFEFP